MRIHTFGVAASLVLVLALPAFAQTPTGSPVDEEITVTADRIAAPTDQVGSSVTVIDRAEIERRRHATVAELLRTVPGVEINRTSGAGSVTSAFLRGGNSAFTLVLVDGVRVNSPATGSYDLSQITTDNVARIEVVRGAQSTLYGSEAIGGVIAITTRRGKGPASVDAYVEAGSFGSERYGASIHGGSERYDYSIAAARSETDGVSAAAERFGNTEEDGDENTTASARLGWALGADGRLDISLRHIDSETEIDGFGFDPDRGFVPSDDPNAVQSREATIAQVDARFALGRRVTQSLRAGVQDENLEATDPDSPFNNFASDVALLSFESQTEVAWSDTGTFLVGLAHETRDAEAPGSFDESLDITSVFAQQRWATEHGALTVGVRHDDHETFGSETTWRVTGTRAWGQEATQTRVHASLGTGFRAPSLNELYFPFFGNPALRPETSTGWDLGLEKRWLGGRLRADVTYFDNEFEDLIGVDDFFTAVNIDQATARGVELTLGWTPGPRWYLEGTHTYTDSEDERTGLALARRPEHRSTLRLGIVPNDRVDGELAVISVRDRIDTGGAPMDDYTRVDLAFGVDLVRGLEAYVRAENLFDEDYDEIPGFTTPGAAVRVGIRWDP